MAKKNCGISRAVAEKNLSELLKRIKEVNSNTDKFIFPYSITGLAVFGSYLSDKPKLGDLDILIKYKSRWDDDFEMCNYFSDVRQYRNLGQWFENPKFVVQRYLRNNKNCFSFHSYEELGSLTHYNPDFNYKLLKID